jgi:hypothetical protein
MAKYRKRPVVIEAYQWHEEMGEGNGVYLDANGTHSRDEPFYAVRTLEGPLRVSDGDWIITGVKGEQYPCKPDIFVATYEPVLRPGEIGDEDGTSRHAR